MVPISFNLEKIALLQAVRYIASLIPGIIILAAIATANPQTFHEFMRLPELGYYAKLSLLMAIAYLIGFALDELVTMVIGFIFGLLGAWLLRNENRRMIIDKLLLVVAPWRDANWQSLASVYLGPDFVKEQVTESQWRFWYLVIKAGLPKLEERFSRRSMLADAVQTCSWALLIARIIMPGHDYLVILVLFTVICFLISGINKIILFGVSFGYVPADLTGAEMGFAMLDEIRKERLK